MQRRTTKVLIPISDCLRNQKTVSRRLVVSGCGGLSIILVDYDSDLNHIWSMRRSMMYIPTTRQRSRLGEVESHQLLLRAGFIKHQGPGLWGVLPMLQATMERLRRMVGSMMSELGAQEVALNGLAPVESPVGGNSLITGVPDEGGDWSGLKPELEMLRLIAGTAISYTQLPLAMYAFVTCLSDEPKTRFGLLQARVFDTLELSVFTPANDPGRAVETVLVSTINRIFETLGLPAEAAEADRGYRWFLPMAGKSGFSEVLRCGESVADPEVSPIRPGKAEEPRGTARLEKVRTPGATTIEQVSTFLQTDPVRIVKTIICLGDGQPLAVLIRGDRELSLSKLRRAVAADTVELAEPQKIMDLTGAPLGFAGPIGLSGVRIIGDQMVKFMADFIVGANEDQTHYINANHDRDFHVAAWADLCVARAGDCSVAGEDWKGIRGLSLARLRRLGSHDASESGVNIRDANGRDAPCRQIHLSLGLSRLVQAAVEYLHDEDGIIWPQAMAPFAVAVLPLRTDSEEQMAVAAGVFDSLVGANISALLDDRPLRPGQKFAEAELIGYPVRLVVGDKSLKDNAVEVQYRDGRRSRLVSVEQAAGFLIKELSDTTL